MTSKNKQNVDNYQQMKIPFEDGSEVIGPFTKGDLEQLCDVLQNSEKPRYVFMGNEYGRWRRVDDEWKDEKESDVNQYMKDSVIRKLRGEVEDLSRENGVLRDKIDGVENWAKYGKVVPGHVVFDDLGVANAKIEALELLLKEKIDRILKLEGAEDFGKGLGRADQEWLVKYLEKIKR
jgi:hypothetical protein